MSPEMTVLWNSAEPFVTHLVTFIIGGTISYRFAMRRFRKQKRHEFLQRRLEEFYGPMLGLVKQVRSNLKASGKAREACGKAWREICEHHPKPFIDHEERFEPYKKQIEYENKRFAEEDLPAFSKMLELLKEKRYLAYTSTVSI